MSDTSATPVLGAKALAHHPRCCAQPERYGAHRLAIQHPAGPDRNDLDGVTEHDIDFVKLHPTGEIRQNVRPFKRCDTRRPRSLTTFKTYRPSSFTQVKTVVCKRKNQRHTWGCARVLGCLLNTVVGMSSEHHGFRAGTMGPTTKLFVCYRAVTALMKRFCQNAFAPDRRWRPGPGLCHLRLQLGRRPIAPSRS
jgi:hypothetical protein